MAKIAKVNVYTNEYDYETVVSRVNYNNILDYWDGNNWTNGGVGMHKGITKLRDNRYVIIIGTQWQDCRDYAYIVSHEEALQEILQSDHIELLELERFSDLRMLYDEIMILEDEKYQVTKEHIEG